MFSASTEKVIICEIHIRTELINELFFTLKKILVQKMLNLFLIIWLDIFGNFGDPRGGKVYTSFPGE